MYGIAVSIIMGLDDMQEFQTYYFSHSFQVSSRQKLCTVPLYVLIVFLQIWQSERQNNR